jgi:hypothetical protein
MGSKSRPGGPARLLRTPLNAACGPADILPVQLEKSRLTLGARLNCAHLSADFVSGKDPRRGQACSKHDVIPAASRRRAMANTSVSANRGAAGDFRVGRVFDRTSSVYTRNFLIFTLVPLVAYLPSLLLPTRADGMAYQNGGWMIALLAIILTVTLGLLSQAILVYGSFQDMRGKQVDIGESFNVGIGRLVPILGLTILEGLCIMVGFMLLFVPGLILITMWFVAVPICIVERRGPWQSLVRSGELTKGHRWKIFGIVLVLYLVSAIVGYILTSVLTAIGGTVLAMIATLLWNGVWGAFFAIFVVVTYYELRVAKEGIDIEQIASVFD